MCVHPFFYYSASEGIRTTRVYSSQSRIGTLRHSARPTRYGGYICCFVQSTQRDAPAAAAVSRQSVAFDGVLAAAAPAASWPKVLSVLFKTSSLEGPVWSESFSVILAWYHHYIL